MTNKSIGNYDSINNKNLFYYKHKPETLGKGEGASELHQPQMKGKDGWSWLNLTSEYKARINTAPKYYIILLYYITLYIPKANITIIRNKVKNENLHPPTLRSTDIKKQK